MNVKKNLYFMITPFDENSLKLVSKLNVDIIKIASFDLGNIPFINLISKQRKSSLLALNLTIQKKLMLV